MHRYAKRLVRYTSYAALVDLTEYARAFSRDPDVYPDPEAFNPDRYIKDGQFSPGNRDPYVYIFGFGRRSATFCRAYAQG